MAEGNVLNEFFPGELVRDTATVTVIDDDLVFRVSEGQMVDLVREVNLVATLHELHDCVRAIVRAQVEVPRHFVHPDLALDLAALFVFELLLGSAKDNIWGALDCLLAECVGDTLDVAILVKCMLVQSAFIVDLVHTRHIDNVEGQDSTGGFGQSQVDVE